MYSFLNVFHKILLVFFVFLKVFFLLLLSEGHSQREAGRGSTSAGLLQNGHDDRSWAGVKSEAHSNERVEIPAEC